MSFIFHTNFKQRFYFFNNHCNCSECYEGSDHAFGTFIKAQEKKNSRKGGPFSHIAGLSVRQSDKFSC